MENKILKFSLSMDISPGNLPRKGILPKELIISANITNMTPTRISNLPILLTIT